MRQPPEIIDGAKVLCWAWAGAEPFGFVTDESGKTSEAIYGLAICQYQDSGSIYRFSCDAFWQTLQDSDYDTVQEAKSYVPSQYQNVPAKWVDYVQDT